jgi:hypothetical protein
MIFSLDLDAAAHRVNRAGKLRQGRITSGVENSSTKTVSRLSDHRLTLGQIFRRALFGGFHLLRIAHDISG